MNHNQEFVSAWVELLQQINSARASLRCSHSAAWYRGHSDSSWKLQPSVFRYGITEDPDDLNEINKKTQNINNEKKKWQQLIYSKTALKRQLNETNKEVNDNIIEEYKSTKILIKEARNKFTQTREELKKFQVIVNGEKELFDEYVVRARKSMSIDSWNILAEMRHHGVPTRLLDWTNRLDIALYFALDQYKENKQNPSSSPCIWVLNPYTLSKRTSKKRSIWNIAQYPDYDYYQRLIRNRDWPFNEPLPIYPPYPIERIHSQKGHFVVFGNNKAPMEQQLQKGERCLKQVMLNNDAAEFCIYYLSQIQNLSPFEVFRDLDSLGQELTESFSKIQRETKGRIKSMDQQNKDT